MGSFKAFNLLALNVCGLWIIPTCGFEFGQHCATLFKNSNFEGGLYRLNEGSGYGEFGDESLNSCKAFSVFSSFRIESGCSLKVCSESYNRGRCREFTKGLASLPPSFPNILSVSCSCANICNCKDEYNRLGDPCARAYVNEGGCNKCGRNYVDLKSGENDTFIEDFQKNVSSLMVKPGCKLTVFDKPDRQGESNLVTCISEKWTHPVKSYQCVCYDYADRPSCQTEKPTSHYVSPVEIPKSFNEIVAMMKGSLVSHPGLLLAYLSHKRKRSTKNAYILLLGTQGVDKTDTIKMIFENQNGKPFLPVGEMREDIIEFVIPVNIEHRGIKNSELRVIDTPELGGKEGLDTDARSLATLEEFLDGHEELKDRIPNFVLIHHKFNDIMEADESLQFVKMIRGLELLRDRITDKNFSNVVFVFSHCTSTPFQNTRDPMRELGNFKRVIKGYTQFPSPIMLALADSNRKFHPKNIIWKMYQVIEGTSDLIGTAVFDGALRSSETFNVTSHSFNLIGGKSRKISKYLAILNATAYSVERTEVADKLASAFDEMDEETKDRFPESLNYLQKHLSNLKYTTLTDLPQTPSGVVKLISKLRQNDAVLFLLKEAFGISPPVFTDSIVAGYSYNILKDRALPLSPFNMGELQISDIGYMLPCVITCRMETHAREILHFFDHMNGYLDERKMNLNFRGNIPLERYTVAIEPGYNVIKDFTHPEGNITTTISAVREYRRFKFIMNDRFRLTDEFTETVTSLHPYNASEYESVEQWNSFFDKYGTHFVEYVYGGGRIEVEMKTKKQYCPEIARNAMSYVELLDDTSFGLARNLSFDHSGYSIKLFGGDKEFQNTDFTKLPIQDAANLLEKWKESLVFSPTILTDIIELRPITEIAASVGENISLEIKKVGKLLFNITLANNPLGKRFEGHKPSTYFFTTFCEKLRKEFGKSNECFQQYQQLILSLKETFKSCDKNRSVMLTELMESLILQHRRRIERTQRDFQNLQEPEQLLETNDIQYKQLFMTTMETLRRDSKKTGEKFQLYQRLLLSMKGSVRECEKQRGLVHIELIESLIFQNRVDNRREHRQHEILMRQLEHVAAANQYHEECKMPIA